MRFFFIPYAYGKGDKTMKAAWFKQKLMAGMITSALFALWWMGERTTLTDFVIGYTFTSMIVLTYGLFASFASDWLSGLLTKNRIAQHLISGLFHCIAGILLWWLGMIAAATFFIIDRMMMCFPLKWVYVIVLLIPSIGIWIYSFFV